MTRKTYCLLIVIVLGLIIILSLTGLFSVGERINDISNFTKVVLKQGLLLFIVLFEALAFRPITKKLSLFLIPIMTLSLVLGLIKYQFGAYIFLLCYFVILINFFIETFSQPDRKLFMILVSILLLSNFSFFVFSVLNYPGRPLFWFFDLIIMATVFIHLLSRLLSKRQII